MNRLTLSTIAVVLTIPAFGAEPLDAGLEYAVDGVKISLVTEQPNVATPTGIDIDEQGQIWAVSSHTHFRPDQYEGPQHDEVVVVDSKGLTRRVFYNRTDATMDLELGSSGWVYLAERDRILRVRDSDGDGQGDVEENIAVLKTEATYPHNGLAGLAWDRSNGDLVFSLGENFHKTWTLTGTDGSIETGTGEGGIFRCRPDGSKLHRIAKGFWNPFGVCIRKDGEMFAAENDPGSRPPCRLLHIMPGGDYGYQRRYGPSPFHPFVCWNGELKGTLPMLHSSGEAPCAVVPCGSGLVVPSWSDNRIDYYPLTPHGATYRTERVVLVRGSYDFRPVCFVALNDGLPVDNLITYYFTDWTIGTYKIHGHGRIWKLEIDVTKAPWFAGVSTEETDERRLARSLLKPDPPHARDELLALANHQDKFIASAAIGALSKKVQSFTEDDITKLSVEERVSVAVASKLADPTSADRARLFLNDPSPDVQFEAVRWITDENLDELLDEVQAQVLSQRDVPYRLFEAGLACVNTLNGKSEAGITDVGILLQRVKDTQVAPEIRGYALRLIPTSHQALSAPLLLPMLESDSEFLAQEAIRSMAGLVGESEIAKKLTEIAYDTGRSSQLRGEAVAVLSIAGASATARLLDLAQSDDVVVRHEALRGLRFLELSQSQRSEIEKLQSKLRGDRRGHILLKAVLDPQQISENRPSPKDTESWKRLLKESAFRGDPRAGRRIFFHNRVGTCSQCHRHTGRGNVVGPDLSAAVEYDKALTSLLEPSRDVDPQYFPWMIVTEDGHSFTGIMLRKGGRGNEYYRDIRGKEVSFKMDDLVIRRELRTSLMPEGLVKNLTTFEIKDLLAYLTQRSETWNGQYSLNFQDGYGGWLDIRHDPTEGMQVQLLWRVGSARSVDVQSISKDQIVVVRKGRRGGRFIVTRPDQQSIAVKMIDPKEGTNAAVTQATGSRLDPMPPRPDISQIKFGPAIRLFNGKDLKGWQLQPASAENGWSVKDGELVNETPKKDFSAYGTFGNLRSEQEFGDHRLHVEFNVPAGGNSGVYVRGLYEAQVVDRDSPMQGLQGVGSVFGRIERAANPAKPGGQWQSYDITLVDRHITVVLNGVVTVDNQPIDGCTGGALFGDVLKSGPVYLQGDHTSVRYRNIRVRPRIND